MILQFRIKELIRLKRGSNKLHRQDIHRFKRKVIAKNHKNNRMCILKVKSNKTMWVGR